MGRTISLMFILLISFVMMGCSQQGQNQIEGGEITLLGSGATFPQPQLEKWIDIYGTANPDVKIEYTGKGSGGGQNDFKQGLVDFACSDPPLKESLWRELERDGQPLQFPVIVGAVVVAYNLPGINDLKLDGETLSGIMMGEIEYWDDSSIKKRNPDTSLPHEKIIVIHRSDSSGTTDIFTNYLSVVSNEWDSKVGAGKTVEWAIDKEGRGVGGKGNPGVITAIKDNPYSIGYTELAYVYRENLNTVEIMNKAGNYISPSPESIKEAVSKVSSSIPSLHEGYKEDTRALLNAEGDNSYPIVAFSHMLIWQNYDTRGMAKEQALKDFVVWSLTEGQKETYLVKGYVGLPDDVREKIINEIGINAE